MIRLEISEELQKRKGRKLIWGLEDFEAGQNKGAPIIPKNV